MLLTGQLIAQRRQNRIGTQRYLQKAL